MSSRLARSWFPVYTMSHAGLITISSILVMFRRNGIRLVPPDASSLRPSPPRLAAHRLRLAQHVQQRPAHRALRVRTRPRSWQASRACFSEDR
jgi:hypothetical protein